VSALGVRWRTASSMHATSNMTKDNLLLASRMQECVLFEEVAVTRMVSSLAFLIESWKALGGKQLTAKNGIKQE
jgi:hypothetical protein